MRFSANVIALLYDSTFSKSQVGLAQVRYQSTVFSGFAFLPAATLDGTTLPTGFGSERASTNSVTMHDEDAHAGKSGST